MVTVCRQVGTHRVLHFYDLQPAIQFRHEVCRSTKSDGAGTQKAIVQRFVLADAFPEWPTLLVIYYDWLHRTST